MIQLLSIILETARWQVQTACAQESCMALCLIIAAALSFILLTASKRISSLRNAASSKIQEIDRSVESQIKEIKLHKEKLRAERMSEIHTKLAEKIRQMLRESYHKHQFGGQTATEQSEPKEAHGRPMSIGETPVKIQALLQHKNFNSFVEPANGFSGSIVENMPNSGKKFASSIKKPRVDLIGAESQGLLGQPLEASSYQVSMPSSLKRKLEIRSFQEARDNFFKLGKRSHHTYSSKRASLVYAWSEDQLGMPSILFEYPPEASQFKFRFFNVFAASAVERSRFGGRPQPLRTKMAGTSDQIHADSNGALKWLNDGRAESPPTYTRKKSTPSWPNPAHASQCAAQQDSSGQTLQGDYLSPEQPSLVALSTSSLENQMRVRAGGDSQNPCSFKLHKCSPGDEEQQEQPRHLNRELQDGIQNHLITYQVLNRKGKSHSQSVTEPDNVSQISPERTHQKDQTTSNSASPSAISTIRGLSGNKNSMEEYKSIYKQIIATQNAEMKAKATKPAGQLIPALDFGKIEEIRQQELESTESNQDGGPTTGLKRQQTSGQNQNSDDALQSKSQSRLKNSFTHRETYRAVTCRSMSQQMEDNHNEQLGQGGLHAPRFAEKTISFALSVAQTPELMSYTQSELGKTSQNLIDNQEYLFAMTNEIVNEHEDETDSSKNRQREGDKKAKKPFEYTSKSSLAPYSQHRSQQSQHYQTTIESVIDHKKNLVNQTVHDSSKDRDMSHENSQSLTPKDSFVYSNSTQTAAINSCGQNPSKSKTPSLFKSTSPYPLTPIDQSQLQSNQQYHPQSTYIGSFLTHTDLHQTTNSLTKAPSQQSSIANATLMTSAPPAHLPNSTPVIQGKLPQSFTLLQQKIEAACEEATGARGTQLKRQRAVWNQKDNDYATHGMAASGAPGHLHHRSSPWAKIKEYSLSGKKQKLNPGPGGAIGYEDTRKHFALKGGEPGAAGIPPANLTPKAKMLIFDQRMEGMMEVGKSSRQNGQSISFNISSSIQSSPRSNIALMNKLAASSTNMFASQHSLGNSSETQAIKFTQSHLSPSRSFENTDKTLNSIQAPSMINHLPGDPVGQGTSQHQQPSSQQQAPPFNAAAQAYHPSAPVLHHGQAQPASNGANAANLSEDLMAKVRRRKTQILKKDQPVEAEKVSNQRAEQPTEITTSNAQPQESGTYWNTNVKAWSPLQFDCLGMGDAWLGQDEKKSKVEYNYNNKSKKVNNNYLDQVVISPNQLFGKYSQGRQTQQAQKMRTPNSKLKANVCSPNEIYKSSNHHFGTDDWHAVRRSAPSISKQLHASPTPPCSLSAKKQQPNGSLSALTSSFDVANSAGNSSSPKTSLQFSPQLSRKQQPGRPVSRHRKRWSEAHQPGRWQIKFPINDDDVDGDEMLRMRPTKEAPAGMVSWGAPTQQHAVQRPVWSSLQQQQQDNSALGDACSTGETPQKKKRPSNGGGSSGAGGAQQPGGSSSKKNKSGEKRTKRQLPPLAQKKAKGGKLSGSWQMSKHSPSKSFGFTSCTLTAEERNQQFQDLTEKLAIIKRKQFHLPTSSSIRHGGGGFQQNQRGGGSMGASLRMNQNKGKLLEVMSNRSSNQGLGDVEKSGLAFGKQESSCNKRADSRQDGSFQPSRPLVWSLSKTSNTSLRKQPRLASELGQAKKPLQTLNKLNLRLNQVRHDFEEEKESQSSRLSATAPKGMRFSFGSMSKQKENSRSGNHSVDQKFSQQSAPQVALQRKLQAMKHKRVTQITTTHSSSNQSDNMSTYTDDANELMELQQYFEAHYVRVCSQPVPSDSTQNSTALQIEKKILRTIKELGEVHYLPVVHVHSSHFLAGVKIVNCEVVGKEVLVRVGGGYELLKHFVQSNSRNYQRQLTTAMRKSGRGITWVVEQFVHGQKHKVNAQKSAVVAPAVTSPGRNRLLSLSSNHLPLPSPTSVPSVPDAKFGTTDARGSGSQLLGDQFFLNQTLRQRPSGGSYPSLTSANSRSFSFKQPRSPAAAGGLRLSSPLDLNNPENS